MSNFKPLIDQDALAVVTIRLEADGEPYAGKVGVAEVIRNRMRRLYSSDGTVSGTVLRRLQFSCWNAADPRRAQMCNAYEAAPLSRAARDAWDESAHTALVSGATLYHAATMDPYPDWASRAKFVVQLGGHRFYRDEE